MKNNKIVFEDIFDTKDIEKGFKQTIEYDILKLMSKVEQEKKQEQDSHIKEIVRETIKEELAVMLLSKGIFGDKFFRQLEMQGFERNCIGCMYAQKNYSNNVMREREH